MILSDHSHFPKAEADEATLRAWLRAEVDAPFAGWDFSRLDGRLSEEATPWDYRALVTAALPGCAALLDMGTGGGEFLASLAPLPPLTCATEGFAPNLPVARARLRPLGIAVSAVPPEDAPPLPFADGRFDLVLSRHESYDPAEVLRVLRPGGRFITQQVGGENDSTLNRLLGASQPDNGYAFWTLDYAREQLVAAGFAILHADEALPTKRFANIGAVVYYLKAVQWQIPDFDVDRYFPRLQEAHRQCQGEGGISSRAHYFVLVAEKPLG
ncbi:MAG TPA: class I SAM-dependent methyltransferase [Thermomicrobiales bacterium]